MWGLRSSTSNGHSDKNAIGLSTAKNSNRHSNSNSLIIMMVNVVVSNSHSNRSRDRTSSRKSYAARLRYFLFRDI